MCVLVVLRGQWVERERLLFPLAVLPLEMTDTGDGRVASPLMRNPLMWIGALVPTVINTQNALHSYFPFIPRINLDTSVPILRDTVSLVCTPRFEVIGLSYLLSIDVSLGIWFFALMAHLHPGIQRMLGWSIGPSQPFSDPAPPSVAHIALGALFFMVFTSFWYARGHLVEVLRKAIGLETSISDDDELMPYRVAVFGGLLSLIVAVAWLVAAGLDVRVALLFLGTTVVILVGLGAHHLADRSGLRSRYGGAGGVHCQRPGHHHDWTVRTCRPGRELRLGRGYTDLCNGLHGNSSEIGRGRLSSSTAGCSGRSWWRLSSA